MEGANASGADRRTLIKDVWPDKTLYGATLLFLTGLVGLIHGLVLWRADVTAGGNLPSVLTAIPPSLTILLSLAVVGLAYRALQTRSSRMALAGAAAGFFAFGLYGLGSLLSLVALAFFAASWMEGEHEDAEAGELDASMWPDKALAASVVLLVTGVLTAAWGAALASEAFLFEGYTSDPATFGLFALAAGALCLLAAGLLYLQRAPWIGIVACVVGVLALGLYVIGPLLSLVALALILLARREGEFRPGTRPV